MKNLKRLCDLTHSERRKIEARQKVGQMAKYTDTDGYLCYNEEELANYKPRKAGRPAKVLDNQSK